jgi:sugar phosphate isomerase/epimerase
MNQADVIRELGGRIVATHIHNNFGFHDDHALPTSGNIDFVPIMRALFDVGYDGALCLEAKVPVEGIRLSFFRHGEDCLFWLLSMREM